MTPSMTKQQAPSMTKQQAANHHCLNEGIIWNFGAIPRSF